MIVKRSSSYAPSKRPMLQSLGDFRPFATATLSMAVTAAASNAVRAALRCAASLGTLDRVRTAFGPVRQRIGLNSGEALVVKRLPNLTRYLECTPWGGQVGDLRI